MKVIKAPEHIDISHDMFSIFLGGSIEMGIADKWQDRLANGLESYPDDLILLNPRRDDWDSSWVQDPTPGTKFYEQVMWEMVNQELADFLVYYFDPATKSPITMLELGAYGTQYAKNTVVCCAPEFYRYGNVAMLCDRYDIKLVHTFDELAELVNDRVLAWMFK